MSTLAYTAGELAKALGVSEAHVYRMAKLGGGPPRLPYGGRLLFPKIGVTKWLEEQAGSDAPCKPKKTA